MYTTGIGFWVGFIHPFKYEPKLMHMFTIQVRICYVLTKLFFIDQMC